MPKLITAVALALFAVASLAQVVVHGQTQAQVQRFITPLALDVSFPVADSRYWGIGDVTLQDDLRTFVCEGVWIEEVRLGAEKPNKKRQVPVVVRMVLRNEPGHDKLVRLRLIVVKPEQLGLNLSEEQTLGEPLILDGIDVEEGQSATTKVARLFVPANLLANRGPKDLKLRIVFEQVVDH